MNQRRQPWMKWYPADWRSDVKLRMCSYAARGLWVDMLTLMHEAEPYGHLLVGAVSPSTKQLAALLGATQKETETLLRELEEAGVFSRTEAGVIYSRRMVRDREKAEIDRENGRNGGNPALKGGVNPPDNPDTPAPDNGGHTAQKLEARSYRVELENQRSAFGPTAARERIETKPAVAAIDLFDERSRAHFGPQTRAFPASTDLVTAERWLAAGASMTLLRGVFDARMGARKSKGKGPIRSLSYLDEAVTEAIRKPPALTDRDATGRLVADLNRIAG